MKEKEPKKPIKIVRNQEGQSPSKRSAAKRYKENELSSAHFEDVPGLDDIDNLDIAIDDTKSDGTAEYHSDDEDEKENFNAFANMQEKLFEIIDNEDVADVVDLN